MHTKLLKRALLLSSLLFCWLITEHSAQAASLAGVTFPETHTLGETELTLNGLGLREATFLRVDVYVAALYVAERSSDATKLIKASTPKILKLRFVRDVSKEKMIDAWRDGFKKNASNLGALQKQIDTLNSYMQDIEDGDSMTFVFSNSGVSVSIKDKELGTIAGKDFGDALLLIWLGKEPPNSGIKEGLLGANR